MLKGLGDMGQILKLQKEFKNVQKRLQKNETAGESTDGTVRATVNGEYRLVDIQIDQAVLASADKRAIEKKIIFAVNDAVDKTKEYAAQEMRKLTGGLNIPGLSNFLK